MEWSLTDHAAEVVTQRAIRREWIAETLERPDWREGDRSDPALLHFLKRFTGLDDRVLRVIVRAEGDRYRVITVFFDRRARRKGLS